MSKNFSLTSAALAVTSHERKSARLESTYDDLVAHFLLTVDSDSETFTGAARDIVIIGGANDGTVTGASLTVDMLKGRDPGAGAKHRDYWKAARAVRIGLVSAAKRAAGDDNSEESTTDYLARIVKAVEAGRKHDLTPEQILDAVKSHLA